MRADAEEEDAAAGQAIDDSKDGVCVLNPEGVMTFVNANMAKIFG